jgi:hypothetical protein
MNSIALKRNQVIKDYFIELPGFAKSAIVLTIWFMLLTSFKIVVQADEAQLQDLFRTEAFRGSFNVFNKLNFVGQILNFIISIISFIGLVSVGIQILLTIAFFTNKKFWLNVHEVQQEHMNKRAFGLEGYIGGWFTAKSGSGINSIFYLFYMFMPDIYELSDLGEGRQDNLTGEENVATWALKTFPMKLLLIFLLSMSFNGSLLSTFAMVVDGLGVAGSRMAEYNSKALVNNLLNAGDAYEFTIGSSGLSSDKLREQIAKSAYKYFLSDVDPSQQTSAVKQQVGVAAEESARKQFTNGEMEQVIAKTFSDPSLKMATADWDNVKVSIAKSSNPKPSTGEIVIDLSNMVGNYSQNKGSYMHVMLTLKKKAETYNYFKLNGSNYDDLNN